ncbi:MAG TPA: DUF58 domain-containing protein [Candidatus Binataceae bacterium]|nr:DUF58 domain-containing protein [Candidatus Binataceae bacterium]
MLATRAFEPDFLRQLDGLMLGTRRTRSQRAGRRTIGRAQGGGIEPENFRAYTAGDDLRFLDWNALARHDQLTIRTFRADRQIEITVMVDASASMAIPGDDDKLGLALLLGAGLAYIGMSETDPVRLAAFAARRGGAHLLTTPFRRRRESYVDFRPFVTGLECGGETRLTAAVGELLKERRTPGITILLSDFLVSPSDYEDAVGRLLAAHHEVKIVHVMGDRESTGDYPAGVYRVRDCETGELRDVSFGPRESAACRARAAAHSAALSAFCGRRGIMYATAFGASHLDEIMKREFPRLGVIA